MKYPAIMFVIIVSTTSACSFNDKQCEDVTLAAEQIQACHLLQKKITQAHNKPIIRTELERRYQKDCVDVRYYRDDHQTAVCGHDGKVKQATLIPTASNND